MGKSFLIDTNVIIDFSEGRFATAAKAFVAEVINKNPTISAITQIELLGFSVVPKQIVNFVKYANISSINNKVINKTIEIRKTHKMKLPDAIIAATALVNNQILLTRNVSDFKNIEHLVIENPYGITL
jgi:predicted nucleic acid-binding protein